MGEYVYANINISSSSGKFGICNIAAWGVIFLILLILIILIVYGM